MCTISMPFGLYPFLNVFLAFGLYSGPAPIFSGNALISQLIFPERLLSDGNT